MTHEESAFDDAMLSIYQRALEEAGYKATRFLKMLQDHGGVQPAKLLIHSSAISEGYTALWERRRLDLTVEATIFDNQRWHPLFTEAEIKTCANRLREYGYTHK